MPARVALTLRALGGNAHTRLYLVRNRTEVRRLPLRVWHFRDGFRVRFDAMSAITGLRISRARSRRRPLTRRRLGRSGRRCGRRRGGLFLPLACGIAPP